MRHPARQTRDLVLRLLPLVALVLVWEGAALRSQRVSFLFSSPSGVLQSARDLALRGELVGDMLTTSSEACLGFVLGMTSGFLLGNVLASSRAWSKLWGPYIVILGGIPIFALAPMMIIWFGVGFKMKVVMAFLSCVFVAVSQAYFGALAVPAPVRRLARRAGATRWSEFWQITVPYSVDWILASSRVTFGLALLGAFMGEYVSSTSGLGHLIVKASGLYDSGSVLVGAIAMAAIAVLADAALRVVTRQRSRLIRLVSVPRSLRGI